MDELEERRLIETAAQMDELAERLERLAQALERRFAPLPSRPRLTLAEQEGDDG